MISNMKVGARLMILAGILGALLVSIGLFGLRSLSEVNDSLKTVYEDRTVPLVDLSAIMDSLHGVRERLFIGAYSSDPTVVTTHLKENEELQGRIERLWSKYMATYLTPEEKGLAEKYAATAKTFTASVAETTRLLRAGDKARATEAMTAGHENEERFEAAQTALRALIELQERVAREEFVKAEAIYEHTRTLTVGLILAGLVLAALLSFWIIRSVTKPLGRLRAVLAAIEQSGDFGVRTGINQRDEIGQTARAFDHMLDSIEAVLKEIEAVMAAVAGGDLSRQVGADARGRLDAIKGSVNASVTTLSTSLKGVMGNIRQVAVATSQASTAVGQVSDGAQNQLNALKQISVGIEQTARAVQEVSVNAQVSSGHAREAAELVRSGRQNMEGLVEVVGLIAGNSEQVTKITQVISQIANQTNMLSLNAAIEAARAGEHGKGFAVVAEEVGRLADHSGRSVQEIVALVERAVKETQRGVEMTRAVNGNIERIAGGVAESDRMAGAIAAAMEQQQSAVVEIRANVGDLTRIGEANASAAEEITATMVELSRLTQQTREAVELFRLA